MQTSVSECDMGAVMTVWTMAGRRRILSLKRVNSGGHSGGLWDWDWDWRSAEVEERVYE